MADTSTPESLVRQVFDALDRKDFDQISRASTEDVQGVDEISRGWLRGRAAMEGYFRSLGGQISNIHSTISDVHTDEIGDVAIVTLVLDQEYDLGGEHASIHAPTTIVTRRFDGDWRLNLLHSVPLPDEA
jgi:ketosteroid isomerase-like protein